MLTRQEEFNQFTRNKVCTLVQPSVDHPIIGTKWLFKNKLDEQGEVIKNKGLVAQGHSKEEGIDYDVTFALVSRLESIRMVLAFACYHDFTLYQMDVKSTFWNRH